MSRQISVNLCISIGMPQVVLTKTRGFTLLWTGGHPITGLGGFSSIGAGWFPGIPMPVWITVFVVGTFVVIMEKTRFGRYIDVFILHEKLKYLN